MSILDWLVMGCTIGFIVFYGIWKTRTTTTLESFLRDGESKWWVIGLSIMATQASAITFLSTPGMAFKENMGFVQLYFGLPTASILVAIFAVPIYHRLNIYTAYEYLESRFDLKTRIIGAGLFLLQRGLASGITIFAPSIILATLMDWDTGWTSLITGVLVVAYTVTGGSRAVNVTQTQQMAVMLGGLVLAAVMVVLNLPPSVSFGDALDVARTMGKLEVVDTHFDLKDKYNIWAGLIAATFLSLSYFGTDQSQVARYLGGKSIRESRVGLYMNALLKLPMQLLILFVGVLLYIFFQFNTPPLIFNSQQVAAVMASSRMAEFQTLERTHDSLQTAKQAVMTQMIAAQHAQQPVSAMRQQAQATEKAIAAVRVSAKKLVAAAMQTSVKDDEDRIFLSFVLKNLPRGIIGFLLAMVFCASMSSISAELNALAGTTTIDIYKRLISPDKSDGDYLKASQYFTLMWGAIAIGFALFADRLGSLVEAVNTLGSLFYGTILGIFMVGLLTKRVSGTSVVLAAIVSQGVIFYLYFTSDIAFLWYNLFGCLLTLFGAMVIQGLRGKE